MKMYGPYKGKDGRWRCVIYKHGICRKTVSYPKYLILNKFLVDHLVKMKMFIIKMVIQMITLLKTWKLFYIRNIVLIIPENIMEFLLTVFIVVRFSFLMNYKKDATSQINAEVE